MSRIRPAPAESPVSGGREFLLDGFFGGRRKDVLRRVYAFLLLAILLLFCWAAVYTTLVAGWWLLHGYYGLEEEQNPYVWQGTVDWILMLLAFVSLWPVQRWLRIQITLFMEDSPDSSLKILSQISEQMDGMQTPDEQMAGLVHLLSRALNMPYVCIETPETVSPVSYGQRPDRQLIRLPLRHNQVELGSLQLAPRLVGGVAVHTDEQLLLDLARQISLTLYAMQLSAELQESRTRLVTAREEARRQLRRDLHDGLGPSLAAMTMQADTARELVYDDPQTTEQLLASLVDQTQNVVADIRRLVHGLRPPALDDVGLFGALELLVGSFTQPGLQVEIHLPDEQPALSAAMEVAIYRIVQEGLTNVSKHSQADRAIVTLETRRDAITLSIHDNGVGMHRAPGNGVGLHSMRERAEELGGTLTESANSPSGVRIVANLPLERGAARGANPRPDL